MHNGLTGDVLTDVSSGIAMAAFYDDGLGLCSYSAILGGYCLVQLDGTAYLRSAQARANRFALDMQRPGEWIIHASLFEDAMYEFHKVPGTLGPLVIDTGVDNGVRDLIVRCADRYLDILSGTVRYRPLDLSAGVVTEATLTGAGFGSPTVSRTRSSNVIALAWADGPICYYDVESRAQVGGASNIGTNDGAWYSVKHDIFVAMRTHQVKVFANAVRPASLSNPTALTTVAQAHVSEVRVRLLGANADACVGELVNWSVTVGSGALKLAQSETDANGYAYNEYVAPVGTTGSVTIQAQALF